MSVSLSLLAVAGFACDAGDDESSGDPAAAGSAGGKSDDASGDADCGQTASWWNQCTGNRNLSDCESDLPIQFPGAAACCGGASDADFCAFVEVACDAPAQWWDDCTAERNIFDCTSDLPLQHPGAVDECCGFDADTDPDFCEAADSSDCDDAGAWWDSCTASRSIFDCESDLPIQYPDAVDSCCGWDSDLDFCQADESNDCDDAEAWWNTCTENRSIFDCESDLPLQHPDAGSCCDPEDAAAPLFCGSL